MIGAEKVMTMTSTYDHRVIQGAESGRFLGAVEEYLQGELGFYDGVFASLGVELGPAPPAAGAAAAAAAEDVAAPRGAPDEELLQAVQAATALLKAFRTHGHLAARLDPLGAEPEGDPALDPEPLGLTPELMAQIPAKILRMWVPGATLADALPHLRETYCGTIAYEIEHISSHRQRVWLREKIESGAFRQPLTGDEQRTLLKRLIEVDALERFMHKAYLGQHQFSIEGVDMTVPMLDELIQLSAAHGGREVVIGMAHRGRLNVLAHNLGRALRHDLRRVRGGLDADRGASPRSPRGEPATSSTTTAPRAPTSCRTGRRSRSTSSPTPATWSTSPRSSRAPPAPRRPPARDPTPTRTPTRRCRSRSTATPPSPPRAWSPRRSTCRRSTATRWAARCT